MLIKIILTYKIKDTDYLRITLGAKKRSHSFSFLDKYFFIHVFYYLVTHVWKIITFTILVGKQIYFFKFIKDSLTWFNKWFRSLHYTVYGSYTLYTLHEKYACLQCTLIACTLQLHSVQHWHKIHFSTRNKVCSWHRNTKKAI